MKTDLAICFFFLLVIVVETNNKICEIKDVIDWSLLFIGVRIVNLAIVLFISVAVLLRVVLFLSNQVAVE